MPETYFLYNRIRDVWWIHTSDNSVSVEREYDYDLCYVIDVSVLTQRVVMYMTYMNYPMAPEDICVSFGKFLGVEAKTIKFNNDKDGYNHCISLPMEATMLINLLGGKV